MKQRYLCVIIILILLCLYGCDAVYRLLDEDGAEEKELVGEVIPFERNPTVEEIQSLLKIYGYNPGKIDGMLGLKTRNAIEKFQKDYGLKPSRFADSETWSLLSVFVENGLIVDGRINIVSVQQALQEAGFSPGALDGKLGPRTKRAVIAFQKDAELKPDGKIGYKTLSKLSEFLLDAQSSE